MRVKTAQQLSRKYTYLYISTLNIYTYTDKRITPELTPISHINLVHPNWFSTYQKHLLNKDSSCIVLSDIDAVSILLDKTITIYEPKYITEMNQPVRDAGGRAIGERTYFLTYDEVEKYYDKFDNDDEE